jgi:hypothetical protein
MEAFIRRTLRALTRRAAEGDPEALVALVHLRAQITEEIPAAARGLHAFGYSWGWIARELGITRQAAQQRFAP